MVSTRLSIPAGSDDAPSEEEDANSADKKVKLALRKLRIDGTAVLKGDSVARRQTRGVYHYRGAVYDITDDTPQEWIDQQPDRYKPTDTPDAKPQQERSKKRARSAVDRGGNEERSPKRFRKSIPTTTPSTAARSKRVKTVDSESIKKPVLRRHRSSSNVEDNECGSQPSGNYTVNSDQSTASYVKAARLEARRKGFHIDAIPRRAIAPPIERPDFLLAKDVMRLIKMNHQIAELRQRFRAMREQGALDEFFVPTNNVAVDHAGVESHEFIQPSGDSLRQNQVDHGTPCHNGAEPTDMEESTQEIRRIEVHEASSSSLSSGRNGTSSYCLKRHDSAASIMLPPAATLTAMNHSSKQDVQLLPKRATALQTERTDKRDQDGRAEQAISAGLLQSESEEAREERVRREYAVIRSWPVLGGSFARSQ